MNNIKRWYLRNQQQITWFLNGWLSLSCLSSLAHGDYVNAVIAGGLVAIGIAINK